MILNSIVGPPSELFGELSPLIAVILVKEEQEPFFTDSPLFFINVWVEVVVPSFATLFSYTPWMKMDVPGIFYAMMVHFWAPYLVTSFLRY